MRRAPRSGAVPASDDLPHDVAAIEGVGANFLGPAALFPGFRPFLAEQDIGAVELVHRDVVRHARAVERLALAPDVEGGGLGLHPGDRADTRHLAEQRHVLLVVDLVEQGFLVLLDVHADDEQVLLGDRHVVLLGNQTPPVTSIVSPVTKSASAEARKQITRAWSSGSATRRSGVRSISSAWAACERFSQCGRIRSVSVTLGAIALTLMLSGPSSWASLRVKAMMPPLAAA